MKAGLLLVLFVLTLNQFAEASVFIVSNANDSGPGSLRQAVLDANATTSADSIVFDSAFYGTPRIITLVTGQISITQPLSIFGPASDQLAISGNNASRVFVISNGASVSMNGLTIASGKVTNATTPYGGYGGGIAVELSQLRLSNIRISGNQSEHAGGIYNKQGTVEFVRVTVDHNIAAGGRNDGSYGGGVFNTGNLSVINSTFQYNAATGGDSINGSPAGSGVGGGLYNYNGGVLTIINSVIDKNLSTGGNNPSFYGGGASGAGISSSGTLMVSNSSITGNTANAGDGLNTYDGNASGGGIINLGTAKLTNVTISGNSASAASGGAARGGGLWESGCCYSTITNVTVSGNSAVLGGGVFLYSSEVSVRNTIIAGNNGSIGRDASGYCKTLGNNLIGTGTEAWSFTNGVNGDIVGTNTAPIDAGLAPLANNGGDTMSQALLPGSRAIDAGNNCVASSAANGGCLPMSLQSDQLGLARRSPQDGVVDIGAVEYGSSPLTPSAPAAPDLQDSSDSGASNSDNITNARTPSFDVVGVPPGAVVDVFRDGVIVASVYSTNGGTVALTDAPPDGPFTYSAKVTANGITSPAGPGLNVTVDTAPPTVSVGPAAGQPTATTASTVRFAIVFSEPVAGLSTAGISLIGSTLDFSGVATTLGGSGASYELTFSGIVSNGQVIRVSLPPGAASDVAGNVNLASTGANNTITVDNVKPRISVEQADGQIDPADVQPINFTVLVSEPVQAFDGSKLSFSGSTADVSNARIVVAARNGGYTVSVSNVVTSGIVRLSVPADRVLDQLGNPNDASTSVDNTVEVTIPAFADIGGRVTDAAGRGVAFANIRLTVTGGEQAFAVANQFGYYRFTHKPTGNVSLVASKKSRTAQEKAFFLTGNMNHVDLALP